MNNSIQTKDSIKRFRIYKSKKQWLIVGMTFITGIASSAVRASADTTTKATGFFGEKQTISADQVVKASDDNSIITIVPAEIVEDSSTVTENTTATQNFSNDSNTSVAEENNANVSAVEIKDINFAEGNQLANNLQTINTTADVYVNDFEKKTAVVMNLAVIPSDDDFISKMSEMTTEYGYQADIYLEAPAKEVEQVQDETVDTQAKINADDILDEGNWSFGGYAGWRNPGDGNDSVTNFLLSKYNKSKNGKAVLNQQLDMTKPIHVSAWEYTNEWKKLFSFDKNSGDSLGIFLTPLTPEMATASNGAGEFLGMAGMVNSVFMGRDLFPNKSDSYKNANRDAVVIRTTNHLGNLQQPNDQAAQGYMERPGGAYSYTNGAGEEGVTFDWRPQPEESYENGKVVGTLTYTLTDNQRKGAKGGSITVTQTIELDTKMTFGVIASNGDNAGHMEFDFGRGGADFQATFASKN